MNNYNIFEYVRQQSYRFISEECCPECGMPPEFEVTMVNSFETKKVKKHLWRFGKYVIVFKNGSPMYGVRGSCSRCGTGYFLLTDNIDKDIHLYRQFEFPSSDIFMVIPKYKVFISDLFSDLFLCLVSYRNGEFESKESYSEAIRKIYLRNTLQEDAYNELQKHQMDALLESITNIKNTQEEDPYEFREVCDW